MTRQGRDTDASPALSSNGTSGRRRCGGCFAGCGRRSFQLRGRRAELCYLGQLSGGRFVAAGYLRALGLDLTTDHPLMLKAVGAEGEGLAVREAAAMKHRHVETVLHFSNNMKSAPHFGAESAGQASPGPFEARPP